MKILHVVQSLRKAGAERMVVNMCNELVKSTDSEVVIFMAVNNINDFSSVLDKRIKVLYGSTKFNFSLFSKSVVKNEDYINIVNEFQPDIIHSHLYFADLVAHSYTNTSSTYISHIHNSEIEEYNGFTLREIAYKKMWTNLNEFLWLRKKYKKHKTNFIACSAGAEKLHSSKIGVGKSIVLPNSSPLPILATKNKSIGDDVNLIWIGRLTDVKRPQLAIKIAHELKAKGINFNLKLAGDG